MSTRITPITRLPRERKWITLPCPTCGGGGVVNPAWLRERRTRADLTQVDIAERADRVNQYICDIEHGRRPCPAFVLAVYEAL